MNWFGRPCIQVVNGVVVMIYRRGTGHATNDGAMHIKFSNDYGATWTDDDKNLSSGSVTGFPMSINNAAGEAELLACPNGDLLVHIPGSNNGTLLGTYQSRSTDGGLTWDAPVLIDFSGIADDSKVYAVDNSFIYSGVIYAGTRIWQDDTATVGESALLKSTDNGITWELVSILTSFAQNTNEIGIEYLDNSQILAVLRTAEGTTSYLSSDMGITWEVLGNSLENSGKHRIHTITHIKEQANWWADPTLIMCGFVWLPDLQIRKEAVWLSNDRGIHWSNAYYVNAGTGDGGYSDIFYNPLTGKYIIVTYEGNQAKADLVQYNLTIGGI